MSPPLRSLGTLRKRLRAMAGLPMLPGPVNTVRLGKDKPCSRGCHPSKRRAATLCFHPQHAGRPGIFDSCGLKGL